MDPRAAREMATNKAIPVKHKPPRGTAKDENLPSVSQNEGEMPSRADVQEKVTCSLADSKQSGIAFCETFLCISNLNLFECARTNGNM